MKFISWNVNGIRACIKKGFFEFLEEEDPDFLCIQETKMQEGQADLDRPGYVRYMYSAEKKGYSGTHIYAKKEALNVTYGVPGLENNEGRVITLEYQDFYLVTAYVPNSKQGLTRLEYRMYFDDILREYLNTLSKTKGVIYCGDLNVAHEEIDIKNPKTNHKNPGFSDEERAKFSELVNSGFVDTFREMHPETVKYSWWSYRFQSRLKNYGWRIDYFMVNKEFFSNVKRADILDDVLGSDHCPVLIEVDSSVKA